MGPAGALTRVSPDGSVLIPLAAVCLLYARGVVVAWRRAGRGGIVPRWRVAVFGAGVGALLLALVSPVDAAADELFAAHMVQHLLLTLAAAPLLVAGRPQTVLPWALSRRHRRRLGRLRARLARTAGGHRPWRWILLATVTHLVVLWAWHAPALYDLAVRNGLVHALEHETLLARAVLLAAALGVGRRNVVRAGVAGAFAASLGNGALGALLAFAPRAWYGAHDATAQLWGISPLTDQQLAAGIMWVPGGIVYLLAGAGLMLRTLREDERRHAPAPAVAARGADA